MKITCFALCLENSQCDDLQLNKIYAVVESENNDPQGYLRIIDESEEDYLYPQPMFEIVNFSENIKSRLIENVVI